MSPPDPRPRRRIRDRNLMSELHVRWRGDCVLAAFSPCVRYRYSLHHIHKHPRDDVEANLVMLCGHGTIGHHGMIESHDEFAKAALGRWLLRERRDTVEYLIGKLGSVEAATEWFRSQLYAPV
jgi:hypothetical protein